MTQYSLATQAEVPPRQLQAFEQGDVSAISTADLGRIAAVLGLDLDALLAGSPPTPSAKVFFRQHRFPDFKSQDVPKLEEALEQARALVAVNSILGRGERPTRYGLKPKRLGDRPYRDGYRLAARVRSALGNATAPLLELQTVLEESFDILVVVSALKNRRVQAASVRDSHTGAVAIILNSTNKGFQNPWRRRVDLAHELGHVLFDPSEHAIDLVADVDVEAESPGIEPLEQRAKAFAAELLMPRAGLQALLGRPRPRKLLNPATALEVVQQVRGHFRTSHEIAVNHLVNTRFLDAEVRQPLLKQPLAISGDSDSLRTVTALERRIAEALASAQISRMRAVELLGLGPWDPLPLVVASVLT